MEVINSSFLDYLIQKGKAFSKTPNGSLTCERFLAAAIAYLYLQEDNAWDPQYQSEARMCYRTMRIKGNVDWPAVYQKLEPGLREMSASSLMVDSIMMQKMLMELRQNVAKTNGRQLSARKVLSHILRNPTEQMQKSMVYLSQGASQEEEPDLSELLDAELDLDTGAEEAPEQPPKSAASVADLAKKAKALQDALLAEVFGQDYAVSVVASGYFQSELLAMTDAKRFRPRATFLFAGPPGVGKTFMAENIAKHLGLPFQRFDMSEYADKEGSLEFCGSDKVYKNGKAGNVTSFVEKNPHCVLLFDEVEKAHLSVIHLFLQMLDAGRLRDNYTDTEVPFKDAIIIMTTNAGKQLYTDSDSGDFSGVSRKVILRALSTDTNPVNGSPFFPAAICSRFASGNVVMFNQMSAHNLRGIAMKEVQRHVQSFHKEIGVPVEVDPRVYTALLLAEGGKADARTVRARSEAFFDNEVYELFRLLASEKYADQLAAMESIRIETELPADRDEVVSLFEYLQKPQVLVFADEQTARLCQQQITDCDVLIAQEQEAAVQVLKNRDVQLILIDPTYGKYDANQNYLNLEDVDSKARDFFHFLRQFFSGVPVYLLQREGVSFSTEEKLSFTRAGVRNVLSVEAGFGNVIGDICRELNQQDSMNRLAKANRVLSFETAQTITEDCKCACIRLFDFKLTLAVAAEDEGSILDDVSKPNVRFADVIGAEDAQRELQYFVQYLQNPKKYLGTGVRAPKGVLLYGPPGTGKTMLAKAMACESGVTFIAAEGNQFIQQYVGQGKDQVHEIFARARKYAPSILFIDEIDAVGKDRRFSETTNSEEAALTAFLTEMDGFHCDPSRPVFVLAATNYDVKPNGKKSLDPALLRRFDRKVYIDLPDRDDRIRYIRMKMSANPAFVMSDAAVDNIALRSTGMSLAELESVLEMALRSAIRAGSGKVTDEILDEAFETIVSGDVKKWNADLLERVAAHEAGHALLSWLSGDKPSYITVVARGNHGGYMQHGDNEGKALYTKQELLARIRTSLGGRAAEMLYYGKEDGLSTGPSGDLSSATATARRILCSYGMDEGFGLSAISPESVERGELADQVRQAVNAILQEQLDLATKLLEENKDKLDRMVQTLLQKNHLNGKQIDEIFNQ